MFVFIELCILRLESEVFGFKFQGVKSEVLEGFVPKFLV